MNLVCSVLGLLAVVRDRRIDTRSEGESTRAEVFEVYPVLVDCWALLRGIILDWVGGCSK
jgi:hypothetical protein